MNKSLRALSYLVQRHLLKRRHLTAHAADYGLFLRFTCADVMGRHIFKYGVYEEQITRFLLQSLTLEAGDIFMDVGANIGWYSVLLARHQPAGVRGYCFEPDPDTFALLEHNLRLNRAVHVSPRRLALSDSSGTKTLYRYADKNTGRHSLLPINAHGEVRIQSQRLDQFVQHEDMERARVRFVKIDVEGYELMVLQGMGGLLPEIPLILSEYSPRYMQRGGLDPEDYLRIFLAAGFKPFLFEGAGIRSVHPDELRPRTDNTNILWLNSAMPAAIPLRSRPLP